MGRRLVAMKAAGRARGVPVSPLRDSRVVLLTRQFKRTSDACAGKQVQVALKLGRILARGRDILKGCYYTWVTDRLRISRWTAVRYAALARMAVETPVLVHRLRRMGVCRLVALAFLPRAARRALARRYDVANLPYREFVETVRRYRAGGRRVTDNMRAHNLMLRVRVVRSALATARLRHVTNTGTRVRLEAELARLMASARGVLADVRLAVRSSRIA